MRVVGKGREAFRSSECTPERGQSVTVYGKSWNIPLYSGQLYELDEYSIGLLNLSAGTNDGGSVHTTEALLSSFMPAVTK